MFFSLENYSFFFDNYNGMSLHCILQILWWKVMLQAVECIVSDHGDTLNQQDFMYPYGGRLNI